MKARFRSVVFVAALAAPAAVMTLPVNSQSGTHHTIVASDALGWKPLRPGAEIAVVSGDPDKAGSHFVLRFRYRGRAHIPPHWHPNDEHITVLSGSFKIGMGEDGDESKSAALRQGAYAFLPAKMPHYAWTEGDTTIQVHGVGPFVINYVNPQEDPTRSGREK